MRIVIEKVANKIINVSYPHDTYLVVNKSNFKKLKYFQSDLSEPL